MRRDLLDAARWARFLAVMSFIFVGLLMALAIYLVVTVMGIYGRTELAGSRYGFIAFVGFYFLVAIIYLYPSWALLKFGSLLKLALQQGDQDGFNLSLRCLRNLFRYVGILVIILLVVSGGLFLMIGMLANSVS